MDTNRGHEDYALFREKQLELSGMLDESSEVIAQLEMNQFRDNLKSLGEKVHNDAFKIQVVGTFKNGKSTFINSFLGENVLPAYALPCTAVINEVKYGTEKRAVIHFRSPLPEPLQDGIPAKTMTHMKKYNMKDIPPLEIPYDEIRDYAVIPIGKDPKQTLLESPYEKIELFWPLPLLENGVEIIDSPGLNEHETRTAVTMEYLSKADAILFVLNATALCSQDEMEFIENNLKLQGFEDPFFIVNRFDLINEAERPLIRQFAQNKLGEYTSNEIFFVSAQNALDGRLNDEEEKYMGSGMPEFEKVLSKFLTESKGKAKLVQPSKELKRILNYEAKDKVIPMQRKMLAQSLLEIKERYENAKPKLENLNTKKEQLYSRLLLRIEQAKPEFKRMSRKSVLDMADMVTTWVDEYEPRTSLGVIPSKEKTNAAANEIMDYVKDNMERRQLEWKQKVLMPFIEEKTLDIFGSVESDLSKLYEEIDAVNVEISGSEYDINSVPVWQRVAGVVGGLAVGDIGLAASGGINGIGKELAKTAAFEIGAGFVLSFLGLFNPVTVIAVLVGSFIMNWSKGQSNAVKKLKEAVVAEVVGKISEEAESAADDLAESVGTKYTEMADQIAGALDAEIRESEAQIQSIIAEIEKGQENVNEREKLISECEEKITDLGKRLDVLIFRLVEG